MNLIENLKWRYATKKFDTSKKVSEDDLNKIMEAIRLAASSYGFQPYEILNIEDTDLREKLKPASWGQSQIVEASHLFVFCNFLKITDDNIDEYFRRKSEVQDIPMENLKDYKSFIKGKVEEYSDNEMRNWNANQTYIALGHLLIACAELKIDACPMEGFEAQKYSEILGLKDKGLEASVLATIGYRSEEDKTQHNAKVRKPMEVLFETL